VLVPIVGDRVAELHEPLLLLLSAPQNATLADAEAVGTILNDDPPGVLVAATGAVVEGDPGGGNVAAFTVTLDTSPAATVSVGYTTVNGTARGGLDFEATTGTVTFEAGGALSQTVTVPILGDTLDEPDEAFTLRLRQANGVAITAADAVVTIPDDDEAPGVSIDDVSVTEGSTGTRNAVLTVTLSAPSALAVTVAWQTADGTATAGADYVATAGEVVFNPGQTSRTVRIPVVGDRVAEPPETFQVLLGVPTNAMVADGTGVVSVVDND
jgi:hypothetical protein